jgi:zinc-binding alcohol dehydrogenase/oxidoreductase
MSMSSARVWAGCGGAVESWRRLCASCAAMKALQLQDKDKPPIYLDVDDPVPAAGEALVRLSAAALNHRDVWIQRGMYPRISYPTILGSDGAGTVVAVGSDDADSSWVGAEVIINPGIDWGSERRFQNKSFNILGMPRNGTLAELVTVPVANLHRKPEHLNWQQAAALPLAGVTAWRVLTTRAGLQNGDTVLITGIGGGVALIAMQLALALGARVFVTSSSADKLQRAQSMGASGGVNYTDDDWVKAARDQMGGGADVIVDSAGGDGFAGLVELLAPGGRIGVYGGTRGKWPPLLAPKLFFKQASIVASTMGSPEEFAEMSACVGDNKIVPVVDRSFALADGAEAFAYLEQGAQLGKVGLSIP